MKKLTLFVCLLTNINATTVQHAIMSYQDYAQVRHETPYVYKLTKQNQVLFYFGANHSCDPENKQYPALEQFFNEFLQVTGGQNCIVLIEGNLRKVRANKHEAITQAGGEGGLITFLAHQANIPCFCPEPDEAELVKELQKTFSDDEIIYRDFAHECQQFNRYKKVVPNIDFQDFHQGYSKHFLFKELSYMKQVHDQLFSTPFDPNDEQFFYNVTNPVTGYCKINYICRAASTLRDQNIVNHIQKFLEQGKNVFVVYGASHAVMQEAAIKSVLESK